MANENQEQSTTDAKATQPIPVAQVQTPAPAEAKVVTLEDLKNAGLQLNHNPISDKDSIQVIIDGITVDELSLSMCMHYVLQKQKNVYLDKTLEELDIIKHPPEEAVEEDEGVEEAPEQSEAEQMKEIKKLKVGDAYKGTTVKKVKVAKDGQKFIYFNDGSSMSI